MDQPTAAAYQNPVNVLNGMNASMQDMDAKLLQVMAEVVKPGRVDVGKR